MVGSQDGPTKIENVHKSSNNNKKNNYPKLSQQNIKEDVGTGSVGEDVETVDAQPDDFDEIEIKQEEASNEIKQVDEDDDNEVNEQEEEEEEEDEEDDEEMTTEEKKVELKNSYKCLLDTLAQTNPKMIEEVKLFVHELRRVTLLREELWLGTLNQIRKFSLHIRSFSIRNGRYFGRCTDKFGIFSYLFEDKIRFFSIRFGFLD